MSDAVAEITPETITEAAGRIAGHVCRTPLLVLDAGRGELRTGLSLKLDFLQPTGSFKVRGAFNALLSSSTPEAGVVAASGGNFGLAVAFAAASLQVPAHIFVPDSSPATKIDGLRRLGAEVHIEPGFYPEALAASQIYVEWRGGRFVHAFDQPDVVAGQGTVAHELEGQDPGIETLVVAVGGGGLIGGIASWYRGRVRLIGVETELTPTLFEARRVGHPIDVAVGGVAASALGAGRVGSIAWSAAARWVDEAVLVSDDAVRSAQRQLWEQTRLLVEPAAAATVAALATGAYVPEPGERVCLLLSGANADPRSLTAPTVG